MLHKVLGMGIIKMKRKKKDIKRRDRKVKLGNVKIPAHGSS